jgi:hypothetical protein
MKLTKSILLAAALTAVSFTSAQALTTAQCTQLGGSIDLAAATCALTAAQQAEAVSLGWLPGGEAAGAGAGGGAGLGGVTIGGGGAAVGAGLILAVVLAGDGSGTTTTTGSP